MKIRQFLTYLLLLTIIVSFTPGLEQTALAAKMPYRIEVDITNQIVTIFRTDDDSIIRQFLCSSGLDGATPLGTFTMPKKEKSDERQEWFYFSGFRVYAMYATRVYKGIMFHSIPCNKRKLSTSSKADLDAFGKPASHGCIRLRWQDAEFIAKNCLQGTKVKIFKSGERDEELRAILYESSYWGDTGMTYKEFLGIPDEPGVLGRYSEGGEVLDLQNRLRALGFYSDEITGVYKSPTVAAVKQLQKAIGETETGAATVKLQELIYSADAPTAMNVTIQEGMSGPTVKNLQMYLQTLRLYHGAIDGIYDIDVIAAVKTFQSAYCYQIDGVATPEIQKAIYYEAGKLTTTFDGGNDYTCEITEETLRIGVVDSSVSIRVRSQPSVDSTALGKVSNGTALVVLENRGDWTKVQKDGSTGYIKSTYLKQTEQANTFLKYTATSSDRVHTIGNTLNDYSNGADFPSDIFAEYIANEGSLDNFEGIADFCTVATDSADILLNLREQPSTSSDILEALPNGAKAKVLLKSKEWTLVSYNAKQGYLLNAYLEYWTGPEDSLDEDSGEPVAVLEEPMYAVVRVTDGKKAPVYDIDSEDANQIGELKADIKVSIVQTDNDWSLIDYKGNRGYMRNDNLTFVLAED